MCECTSLPTCMYARGSMSRPFLLLHHKVFYCTTKKDSMPWQLDGSLGFLRSHEIVPVAVLHRSRVSNLKSKRRLVWPGGEASVNVTLRVRHADKEDLRSAPWSSQTAMFLQMLQPPSETMSFCTGSLAMMSIGCPVASARCMLRISPSACCIWRNYAQDPSMLSHGTA